MPVYDFLAVSGWCFIAWCVSRLLATLQDKLDRKKPDSIPAKLLSIPAVALLVLGGFFGLYAIYFVQLYPNRVADEELRKEERERYQESLEREIRAAREDERRRASAEYKELVELRIQSAIQKDREARNEQPPSE